MNKKFKMISVGAVLLLGLSACGSNGSQATAAAAGCTAQHQFTTIKPGVLSVALTNTPPYSFEQNGKLAGIDSEIVTDFAAKECLKVEYAPYTYATAVPAVQQGRVDVAIGGFYRTEARAKVVRLSAPAYLDELTVISKDGISSVDGLLGKKLGTVEGYLWVDALKKLPNTETRTYPDSLSLAQDVKSKRIDVGLDGYGAAAASTKGTDYKIEVLKPDNRVPATVEPSQTSLLINPANAQLGDAMDKTISAMQSDGRLVKILANNGLPASAAKVGPARLI